MRSEVLETSTSPGQHCSLSALQSTKKSLQQLHTAPDRHDRGRDQLPHCGAWDVKAEATSSEHIH